MCSSALLRKPREGWGRMARHNSASCSSCGEAQLSEVTVSELKSALADALDKDKAIRASPCRVPPRSQDHEQLTQRVTSRYSMTIQCGGWDSQTVASLSCWSPKQKAGARHLSRGSRAARVFSCPFSTVSQH